MQQPTAAQKNYEIKDARKPIEAISKLVENLESDDKAQQSQTRLTKCKS
jgi:hypothetical protein